MKGEYVNMSAEGLLKLRQYSGWDHLEPGSGLIGFMAPSSCERKTAEGVVWGVRRKSWPRMVTVDSPWISLDYLRVVLAEKRLGGKRYYSRMGSRIDPIDISVQPVIWAQMMDGTFQAFVGGRGWKDTGNGYVFDPDGKFEGVEVGTCFDLFLTEQEAYAPKLGMTDSNYAEVALQGLAVDWLCANLCTGALLEQDRYVPMGVSSLELPEMRCLSYGKCHLRESNVDKLVLELARMGIWSIECYPSNLAGVYGHAERVGQDVRLTYKEDGKEMVGLVRRETLCSSLSRVIKTSFAGRVSDVDLIPVIPEGQPVNVTPSTVLFTPAVRRDEYPDIDTLKAEVGFGTLEMLRCLAVLTSASMADKQLTFDAALVSGQSPLVNMDEISPLIQKVRNLPGSIQISNGLLNMDPDNWPQRMGAKEDRERRREEMYLSRRGPVTFRGSLFGARSEGVSGELTPEEKQLLSEGRLTGHLQDRMKKSVGAGT